MTDKVIGLPQSDVEDMVKAYEHLARMQPDDDEGRNQAESYKFKAKEMRKHLLQANYTPPQSEAIWPKLDRPAKVNSTRFHAGVSSRLVVEAAQRLHGFDVTPEKEAARILLANEFVANLRQQVGLESIPASETQQ